MFESMPRILQSGLFDSRLMFAGKTYTSPRTVTEYELELFFEDGGVSEVNGKSYPIKAGRILFARPGDVRRSRLHFKCLFVHFECADEKFAQMMRGVPAITEVQDSDAYKELFVRLSAAEQTEGEAAGLQASAVLLQILAQLLLIYETPACSELEPRVVVAARRFIDEHFAEPLELSDVARACHLSPNYFHRLYTALSGHTPHDYLMDKRIAQAKIILRTEDVSVAETADRCGFASQSYFTTCFKERTGVTPGQYRKNLRYPDAFDG